MYCLIGCHGNLRASHNTVFRKHRYESGYAAIGHPGAKPHEVIKLKGYFCLLIHRKTLHLVHSDLPVIIPLL